MVLVGDWADAPEPPFRALCVWDAALRAHAVVVHPSVRVLSFVLRVSPISRRALALCLVCCACAWLVAAVTSVLMCDARDRSSLGYCTQFTTINDQREHLYSTLYDLRN